MSNFFIAWGKSVRGAPIDPLPIYDRSWLKPRSPPKCSIEHWGHEFKPISPNQKYAFPPIYATTDPGNIANVLLHYSSDFISTKLKSQVKRKLSTFEVLLAHIWRKITMSRGLNDETSMLAKVSVNGRCRLKPAVPNEFFGNLVLTAHPQANAKTLLQGDLETAASIIHEAVRDTDDEYFRSVIDFGAMNEGEELVRVDDDISTNVMLPDLEADSLLGFRFQELDFGGGGELCAFTLSWVPLDGLVVLLPALEKDGGVNVFVGLLEEHARVLKEISHSLD
ncbi:uncharacterized protein A4U43_C02F19240 [Asparagus officinalis]|uniref:Uncharacterized protein n=2 Tax=Asparagus officinalis TaxID=4686 RepID=A0A5P1FL79_ASPOF|nr:uncharacterized protein A4U43_C02F19240 [Asparagus officinalis]